MDLQLKDKLVLITGSTSGIGKAAAKSFLQEGAAVIVNGRKQETVDRTIEEAFWLWNSARCCCRFVKNR